MRRVAAVLVLVVLLASCSGGGDGGDDSAAPGATASPTSGPPTTQAAANGEIDALFDVGGHKLHLTCQGKGSPTVVYLHGHSQQPGDASGGSAGLIPGMVADNGHRFCGYDRANTGTSDKVPGPLDGKTTVTDRWDHTEWKTLEEQVDQLTSYQQAHDLLGEEPAIPVTYLLARPSNWTGPGGYEAVVEDYIAKYVDRFSPGVLKDVQSPHYMEEAVPERVVQELEKVIDTP